MNCSTSQRRVHREICEAAGRILPTTGAAVEGRREVGDCVVSAAEAGESWRRIFTVRVGTPLAINWIPGFCGADYPDSRIFRACCSVPIQFPNFPECRFADYPGSRIFQACRPVSGLSGVSFCRLLNLLLLAAEKVGFLAGKLFEA